MQLVHIFSHHKNLSKLKGLAVKTLLYQEFKANSHLRFSMKPDPCESSISLRLVYIMYYIHIKI